jgi:hypothetical protein
MTLKRLGISIDAYPSSFINDILIVQDEIEVMGSSTPELTRIREALVGATSSKKLEYEISYMLATTDKDLQVLVGLKFSVSPPVKEMLSNTKLEDGQTKTSIQFIILKLERDHVSLVQPGLAYIASPRVTSKLVSNAILNSVLAKQRSLQSYFVESGTFCNASVTGWYKSTQILGKDSLEPPVVVEITDGGVVIDRLVVNFMVDNRTSLIGTSTILYPYIFIYTPLHLFFSIYSSEFASVRSAEASSSSAAVTAIEQINKAHSMCRQWLKTLRVPIRNLRPWYLQVATSLSSIISTDKMDALSAALSKQVKLNALSWIYSCVDHFFSAIGDVKQAFVKRSFISPVTLVQPVSQKAPKRAERMARAYIRLRMEAKARSALRSVSLIIRQMLPAVYYSGENNTGLVHVPGGIIVRAEPSRNPKEGNLAEIDSEYDPLTSAMILRCPDFEKIIDAETISPDYYRTELQKALVVGFCKCVTSGTKTRRYDADQERGYDKEHLLKMVNIQMNRVLLADKMLYDQSSIDLAQWYQRFRFPSLFREIGFPRELRRATEKPYVPLEADFSNANYSNNFFLESVKVVGITDFEVRRIMLFHETLLACFIRRFTEIESVQFHTRVIRNELSTLSQSSLRNVKQLLQGYHKTRYRSYFYQYIYRKNIFPTIYSKKSTQ